MLFVHNENVTKNVLIFLGNVIIVIVYVFEK